MKVPDVMTREIRTIHPEETLERAACLMWENDCGCLPVVDGQNHPVGMLTDRDVCMNAYTQGRALADLPVRGAMSATVHAIAEHDPLERAERMMQEHQVRRLPVVNADGRLTGLVSLMDIARAATARPLQGRTPVIRPDEVAMTLAAVGRPHACLLPTDQRPGRRAAREVVVAH
ncbi:MAG: CBS domain-containing protein [Planctomycetota bacterium]|jgi:CBS domain-containing protein